MVGMMEGKSGLVTGAGSGIGRASAILLAAEGASVVVSDISVESGQETVAIISGKGGRAIFVPCDVGRQEEIKALVDGTIDAFGRLDFAHNNAGVVPPQVPISDTDFADWSRVFDVNLHSVFWSLKYQIPAMASYGGGAIVNTASANALRPFPNNASYGAAKCAVVHLTKTAAREAGKHNIRVNAICPGLTRTPMFQAWGDKVPDVAAELASRIPLARVGEPEEQANAVLWLCSDRSSYVSGVALPVDGADTA